MTDPYYTDDWVTLYHGDCREELAWLDADVLVTDPPYGISYQSNMNRDRRNLKLGRPVNADGTTEIRESVLAAWGDRAALVFGRWDVPRPAATRARLIWDKGSSAGMGDLSLPWGRSEEEVYVLGRGFEGKREPNVIRVQMLMSGDRQRPDHPTPKPVSLMGRLIAKCPPGVIADPFTGAGATLLAAKQLGRHAIGVELEERYCHIAANRLAQDTLPFPPETPMTDDPRPCPECDNGKHLNCTQTVPHDDDTWEPCPCAEAGHHPGEPTWTIGPDPWLTP